MTVSSGTAGPVFRGVAYGTHPAALENDPSAQPSHCHGGPPGREKGPPEDKAPARHPRLAVLIRNEVVDTGRRRHDGEQTPESRFLRRLISATRAVFLSFQLTKAGVFGRESAKTG
jgi:hypothetical protein